MTTPLRPRMGINAIRSSLRPFYPTLAEQDGWLTAPHPLLDGRAAIDFVNTSEEDKVWALIDQLESGAVV